MFLYYIGVDFDADDSIIFL